MKNEIELLSPAGNADALRAAVQSGADAVYIGGPMFNARSSAKNFTMDEIWEMTQYCHFYGVDLHIAVNTLIKEREIETLAEYVSELNKIGVDALIVQDLGAASLIHSLCPDLPLHASTQMTVTSAKGVKYLENMGFSRVVLARELSKNEIEEITRHTKAEIEVFVHGAICMCYSGQCLMSSMIGGRSANRGRCAQPCRLPYTLIGADGARDEGYILSSKDLALIERLSELKKINVKSLKIEGRLKRAEYVSAVTGIYRKYLDNPSKVSPSDMTELKNAFSRSGFTQGYFDNNIGRHMMSLNNPGNAEKNIFSDEAKKRVLPNAYKRKIPVTVMGTLKRGDCLRITLTDSDYNSVSVNGTIKAETAINRAVDKERLSEQLSKFGGTPFYAEYIDIDADGGITIPIKEINAVRREACEKLTEFRKQANKRSYKSAGVFCKKHNIKKTNGDILLTAECETAEQARICDEMGADVIYVSPEIAENVNLKAKIVAKAADIFDGEDIKTDAVMVSSPAAMEFYADKKIYCGFRFNVCNSYTADILKRAELITLSPELNIYEIAELTAKTNAKTEVIAYGRLTLMLMKNSPQKAEVKAKGSAYYRLRDRKNEEFPLIAEDNRPAKLLNSKPIFTADIIDDIKKTGADAFRLIFTDENAEMTRKIFSAYKKALNGVGAENIFKENGFTRGHFFRGVE